MPKKIENPLREGGLPSKIYLRAFSIPKSRYQIAREIYDIPLKQIPPTNKVIIQTKKLMTTGFIKESDGGIISNVISLVAEIENDLKAQGEKLTESEKRELIVFLDNGLRKLIPEMQIRDWNVPAYIVLTQSIGWIVATQNIYSQYNNQEFIQYLKDNLDFSQAEESSVNNIMEYPLSSSLRNKLQIYIPRELIDLLPLFDILQIMVGELKVLDEVLQENLTTSDYKKIMDKLKEKMIKKKTTLRGKKS